ncbi:hypothetical protein FOPG_13658 [Fusarium oxysporum f. sp. conglutinans race 2 54008]|uniref:Uncharacterized protein n=3 Tax=Fusarium oxysporum TaxID=5507 RepID=X0L1N0_FUSOX|nr:hypothetical protein FOVG_02168 [Fusarium oxysporum f. sp. pisi HDV247]EXL70538.1 hypothetical protein FOPG_13658 [Fusarium oxysporum f. sp. conglutinans race 2 54008]EXM14856.1 hypothetical protein FOTG_16772 [Fusarium oxysporum f. sp. vasinfectum 25433]
MRESRPRLNPTFVVFLIGHQLLTQKFSRYDVMQALVSHEKKLRPMVERLQARSKRLASTYISKNILVYYVRTFL